jgi:hypothetical protein
MAEARSGASTTATTAATSGKSETQSPQGNSVHNEPPARTERRPDHGAKGPTIPRTTAVLSGAFALLAFILEQGHLREDIINAIEHTIIPGINRVSPLIAFNFFMEYALPCAQHTLPNPFGIVNRCVLGGIMQSLVFVSAYGTLAVIAFAASFLLVGYVSWQILSEMMGDNYFTMVLMLIAIPIGSAILLVILQAAAILLLGIVHFTLVAWAAITLGHGLYEKNPIARQWVQKSCSTLHQRVLRLFGIRPGPPNAAASNA